jgi:hypothetical protein
MGKLFHTPEVVRVYTGSFWDKPLLHNDYEDMFNADEQWLMDELIGLPSVAAERKVNAVVKRIRLVKVHICILSHLRKKMPRYFGHASVRKNLLDGLEQVFETVRNQYGLPEGDMPNIDEFRERLSVFQDFTVFPMLEDFKDLELLEEVLTTELPAVMKGASSVSEIQTPKKQREMPEEVPTTELPAVMKGASSASQIQTPTKQREERSASPKPTSRTRVLEPKNGVSRVRKSKNCCLIFSGLNTNVSSFQSVLSIFFSFFFQMLLNLVILLAIVVATYLLMNLKLIM